MLSAFKLDNCRLTRLELDESDDLTTSLWVDLVEPDAEEREFVQSQLGQSLATRPELEDIEASARFFEDEDGLHIHSFFLFLKTRTITPVTPRWRLPFVMAACIRYVSASCLPSVFTACAPARKR
ncbi:hypothetical protein DZJ_38330 [Dickeya ananatis]